jgi:hypothetical protein
MSCWTWWCSQVSADPTPVAPGVAVDVALGVAVDVVVGVAVGVARTLTASRNSPGHHRRTAWSDW